MKQPRLNLYTINIKYIRNLSHVDSHVFSVSPQVGKDTRPFLGVIVVCDKKQYCVPLSSPKPKHSKMKNDIDFFKVFSSDDKLIGVLNFNNMIPVSNRVITKMDLKIHPHDSAPTKHYKNLIVDQLTFCQKNQDAIVRKANKLYRLIIQNKARSLLKRRCCKFAELEKALSSFSSFST